MENLPIEIQWNIFKFMRHPVAEMFMVAKAEYQMEYHKFVYWENEGQHTRPTFIKYLETKMTRRHMRHIDDRLYANCDSSDDDESDDESDDDYCPEVEHANSDYGN